jgi:hypothetical protein
MSDKARGDVDEAKASPPPAEKPPLPTWHARMAQKLGCQPNSFWWLWRLGLIRRQPDGTYYVPLDDLAAYVENSALLPGTKLDHSLRFISETQANRRARARMWRE